MRNIKETIEHSVEDSINLIDYISRNIKILVEESAYHNLLHIHFRTIDDIIWLNFYLKIESAIRPDHHQII